MQPPLRNGSERWCLQTYNSARLACRFDKSTDFGSFEMASFNNGRNLVERIYKCIKGSSKADYREFTTTCISLARMIDLAVAKNQKLSIVQELPQLLKKVCEQKDNEMFQPAIMVLLLSVKNSIYFGWFTNAEGQEVLQMSKELVDFFTGLGGWSPIEGTQASQFISTIMPRFYPLLNIQSIIVALETKPGYEAMVCDFYVLKKPSASEELRMFVIRKDNQDTSSCLVTPNHVNFLVNGKGVEKRSLTSMDVGPQMPSNVTSMLKIGTNLLQIVGDFPGPFLIAIALTTSKTEYSSPMDLQIFNHDSMKAQTDEELIEGPSRVSLLCPISHKRIASPVKGASCRHHQCFDYNTFMEINSRRPSWRCPYCNRNVSFPDLRLDLRMFKILKECQGNAVDVMVSEDGSWETLNNEEAPNTNVVAIRTRRKKDGNSPNSSGESSTEEGEIRLENNNSNYIELSDTEDQERPDHENACQSFPVVSLGGGGGDRILEDRKPDVREINAAMGTSSNLVQMETARDGGLLVMSSSIAADPSVAVPCNLNGQGSEGGFNASEGLAERPANREISRSPIAIQALPAQTGTSNPNHRARSRTSPQPNSPAHPNGGIYPTASSSQLGVNQRPLQVQLPSFVGIQDGQVLLNPGQHQQLQLEIPELLQSLQGPDLREYRQRFIQQLQQQRTVGTLPFVTQSVVQPASRVSRDHPYYSASRNVNQIRAADRQSGQQASSLQQTVRPDSPNLLDNQFWQQVRQLQPTQQQLNQQQVQLQGHLNLASNTSNITREETVGPGLPTIAEGIPMFNQSPGGPGAVASALRRQTSQNTRTVPPQYLPSLNNPLIVPNTNISPRDPRWVTSLDGVPSHVDTSSPHIAEQMQRRMRGSITSPVGRDSALNASVGLSWLYGGSSQASRFSPGISSSGWSNDVVRHLDPPRNNPAIGTNVQSIQTASTLVSDFDNWFDTQGDIFLAHQGAGDLGDPRPG